MDPVISVIIPTYNREKLIITALNSILTQSYQDFEILIIDDASTDNTKTVIENFNHPRIRYFRLDKNSGQCVARNYGIKRAKGKYIAFLDSDDEWLQDKLVNQLKCFEEGPSDLGSVYGYSYQKYVISNTTILKDGPYYRGDIYEKFCEGFCPPTPSMFLVKKEVLEKVNYFDENLITFVDLDLWLRISKEYKFDFVEQPVIIKYEQIGDQYVNNFDKRYNGYRLFMKKWKDEILKSQGEAVLNMLKTHLVMSIVGPVLSTPPADFRKKTGRVFELLFEIRSINPKFYIKAILLYLLGPGTTTSMINKAKSPYARSLN